MNDRPAYETLFSWLCCLALGWGTAHCLLTIVNTLAMPSMIAEGEGDRRFTVQRYGCGGVFVTVLLDRITRKQYLIYDERAPVEITK